MKYTQEYLEEIAILGPLVGAIGTGLAAGGDIAGTFIRPPLDLAKQIGNIERHNIYKRTKKATFAGSESPIDLAVQSILAPSGQSLGTKLAGRVGDLYRLANLANILKPRR